MICPRGSHPAGVHAAFSFISSSTPCPVPVGFCNQVECSGGKKAIVVFVPVPQLKAFQKIQTRSFCLQCGEMYVEVYLSLFCNFRLVRELEKKFSGKHVVFVAQRRILPKPTRKANKLKQKRPR